MKNDIPTAQRIGMVSVKDCITQEAHINAIKKHMKDIIARAQLHNLAPASVVLGDLFTRVKLCHPFHLSEGSITSDPPDPPHRMLLTDPISEAELEHQRLRAFARTQRLKQNCPFPPEPDLCTDS